MKAAKHMACTEVVFSAAVRGFAKKKPPKIRDYYGSGRVGPGLTLIFCVWKIGPK